MYFYIYQNLENSLNLFYIDLIIAKTSAFSFLSKIKTILINQSSKGIFLAKKKYTPYLIIRVIHVFVLLGRYGSRIYNAVCLCKEEIAQEISWFLMGYQKIVDKKFTLQKDWKEKSSLKINSVTNHRSFLNVLMTWQLLNKIIYSTLSLFLPIW